MGRPLPTPNHSSLHQILCASSYRWCPHQESNSHPSPLDLNEKFYYQHFKDKKNIQREMVFKCGKIKACFQVSKISFKNLSVLRNQQTLPCEDSQAVPTPEAYIYIDLSVHMFICM